LNEELVVIVEGEAGGEVEQTYPLNYHSLHIVAHIDVLQGRDKAEVEVY
jgi:hypothetical protein